MPPTISQQRGIAYAAMPFALLSCASSGHVIYYLLCKERHKLRRLYHRLILAMNLGVLILSSTYAWGAFAVPRGTPHYAGASGTVATCTANGFLYSMLSLTVPTYYGSLSLQAFMGSANNFKEEKYRWIEIPIHLVAWCVPCAISTYVAATENFNPYGGGCTLAKAPQGCEADPTVQCERGEDIQNFEFIVGFGLISLYFVFPPSIMLGMYCWLKKIQKRVEASRGADRIKERSRKRIMQKVAIQIYLYLFSFWFTIIPSLINLGYQILVGTVLPGLLIFANCTSASQGFVMTMVYFKLEKMGSPIVEPAPSPEPEVQDDDSVRDIPSDEENGQRDLVQGNGETTTPPEGEHRGRGDRGSEAVENSAAEGKRRRRSTRGSKAMEELAAAAASLRFNIFCADPDEDSPWAEFFRDEDDDDLPPEELPPQLRWRPEEGNADENLDLKTKLYLYENVLRI